VDTQISCDVRNRPTTLKRETNARSSNSSGYFLGLDMTAENLLSPGQHPGVEVSAETGPAHCSQIVREEEGAATAQARVCAAPIRGRRRRVIGVVYVIEFEYAGHRLLTER
jgi:hypothetical protein